MRSRGNQLTVLLLACLLVLAQQAAFAHAISHLGTPGPTRTQRIDLPSAADKPCPQCVAFAQTGTALASPADHPATVPFAAEPALGAPPAGHTPAFVPPFLSRAPPR